MPYEPYHQSLSLQNFTAFQDVSFDFARGINVFVGENGTGKTHVMKALYAMHISREPERWITTVLEDLFQIRDLVNIIRFGYGDNALASVRGRYNNDTWGYSINSYAHPETGRTKGSAQSHYIPMTKRPVFIPAIDMMGHTRGFTEAYDEVRLDFDLTCRDIVNLLKLESKTGQTMIAAQGVDLSEPLNKVLGGQIEQDNDGRFYLVTKLGRQPMPLVAEGLRKIATLVQLQKNGWLSPGAALFWDEPEVNLNPVLMDEIITALFSLARQGIQIFLATHSYVILKELDLQARKEDKVLYFAFQRNEEGTKVNATNDLSRLIPNPILEQYDSLYDRELTRSTGRNRLGERVG